MQEMTGVASFTIEHGVSEERFANETATQVPPVEKKN
jgi:hypothetical protein